MLLRIPKDGYVAKMDVQTITTLTHETHDMSVRLHLVSHLK